MRRAFCRWSILFLVLFNVAWAQSATVTPACQPGMRVALDTHGNFYFFSSGGQAAGIDFDVFNELGQRLLCPPLFQTDSVVRLFRHIELGEVDAGAHKFADPERARFAWLVPYLRENTVVLIRKNISAKGMAHVLADENVLIGAGKGWLYGRAIYNDFVKQMRHKKRVVEVADVDQLFALLRGNRVQMLVTSAAVYRRLLKPDELAQYRVEDWDKESPDPVLHLMFSRQTVDEALLAQITNTLCMMQKDGTLRRIVEKYVAPEEASRMLAPVELPCSDG